MKKFLIIISFLLSLLLGSAYADKLCTGNCSNASGVVFFCIDVKYKACQEHEACPVTQPITGSEAWCEKLGQRLNYKCMDKSKRAKDWSKDGNEYKCK